MTKPLSEMTLEELWELFPIILTPPNEKWQEWYEEEAGFLKSTFPEIIPTTINHIGSTAIGGIWAKPIIDILIEVDINDMQKIATHIINAEYILMNEGKRGMDFNKGYTPAGFAEKVFHIHLRRNGDNEEVYFRDYLIEHPSVAKEYENLKKNKLWAKYEYNRDAYTNGKADFVKKYTEKAKKYCEENMNDNDVLVNIDKLHTTKLGKKRIKRNLNLPDVDTVQWCKEKIKVAEDITRQGKNWYVHVDGIVITINAHSFTIITAHKK